MKKQLISLILVVFLLSTSFLVGQNTNYPTKKVNGIEYYVYTVQVSEGLFAVARKFDTTPDEVSKANPYIKNGLKVGQQILVPVPAKSAKNLKTEAKTKSSPQFIQHKVEKKQTLFAIAHKYNVSQEDLKKYNPEIEKNFKEGLILRIPIAVKPSKPEVANAAPAVVKPASSTPAASTDSKHFTIHIVKQDETLFSICKRYNVEIKDVVKVNPGAETKITAGSELKIPIKPIASTIKEQKAESAKIQTKTIVEKQVQKPINSKFVENKVIRIGFLLPFMLDQPADPKFDRFINFYSGALLAIEQAKQKGVSFEIYTFDTENSEEKLTEALANPELKSLDLLIGPAFTNQVPLVSSFAKENKINTLIPFTGKVPDIDNNPYLFQFNPGSDTELSYLMDLLSGKYKNMHVVFAQIQGVSSSDEGKLRAEALRKELTKERKTFSTIELSGSTNAGFTSVLKKGQKNLVIFNTDKYATVSQYTSSLNSISANFDITVLEQYSWRNQTEKMPKSIYLSPFTENLNYELVNNFNQKFDQFYGKDLSNDSPRYDILGYDLTNYFVTLIQKSGSKFGKKISSTSSITGIQSQPLFERSSGNSGFINQRVYLGEDKAQ